MSGGVRGGAGDRSLYSIITSCLYQPQFFLDSLQIGSRPELRKGLLNSQQFLARVRSFTEFER